MFKLALAIIIGSTGQVCVFSAVKYMNQSEAMLIHCTGPFYAPFMCYLVMREKIKFVDYFRIVCGFLGVFLIEAPWRLHEHGANYLLGVALVITSSILSAAFWVCLRSMD